MRVEFELADFNDPKLADLLITDFLMSGGNRDMFIVLFSEYTWRKDRSGWPNSLELCKQAGLEGEAYYRALNEAFANAYFIPDKEGGEFGLNLGMFSVRTFKSALDCACLYGISCGMDLKKIPYSDFLQTQYWKAIREAILLRDYKQCQTCNSTESLHVHHKTYEHRGEEYNYPQDLITLCANCHGRIHEKQEQVGDL